jgi:hypothetical protein
MKINFKRYVIATHERPTEFLAEAENEKGKTDGKMTDYFEDALLFNSEDEASLTLEVLDDKSKFFIMPVDIKYEF